MLETLTSPCFKNCPSGTQCFTCTSLFLFPLLLFYIYIYIKLSPVEPCISNYICFANAGYLPVSFRILQRLIRIFSEAWEGAFLVTKRVLAYYGQIWKTQQNLPGLLPETLPDTFQDAVFCTLKPSGFPSGNPSGTFWKPSGMQCFQHALFFPKKTTRLIFV